MSFLLCIHSYGGANETVVRHWPYFQRAGASRIVGIGTSRGDCTFPIGADSAQIGDGLYMNGPNLPARLYKTIEWCLLQRENRFVISEYDTLFFKPLPDFSGVCAHHTGGRSFDARAAFFSHNPWCMDRESAVRLADAMAGILADGLCGYGTAESSPDVFFAFACEQAGIAVRHDLFRMFTRNRFDTPGALEEARAAYRDGVEVIHGCKTAAELEFITGA